MASRQVTVPTVHYRADGTAAYGTSIFLAPLAGVPGPRGRGRGLLLAASGRTSAVGIPRPTHITRTGAPLPLGAARPDAATPL